MTPYLTLLQNSYSFFQKQIISHLDNSKRNTKKTNTLKKILMKSLKILKLCFLLNCVSNVSNATPADSVCVCSCVIWPDWYQLWVTGTLAVNKFVLCMFWLQYRVSILSWLRCSEKQIHFAGLHDEDFSPTWFWKSDFISGILQFSACFNSNGKPGNLILVYL